MATPITTSHVLRLWLPLAGSWLLMGAELPLFTAFVGRLPDDEANLAAFGSVVYSFSLLVEAPIIMLLAASTALARDRQSYRLLWRFTMSAGAALTALHVLVAFTPLYDVWAGTLVGVPPEVLEPGRIGLQIMTPWTWAIAYRRFQQGVLIRSGDSGAVVQGTAVRLFTETLLLGAGYATGSASGIVVGTIAIAAGVTAEAIFAGIRARAAVRRLPAVPSADAAPLDLRSFLVFYVPLAFTPLMTLVIQPIGAAAMSRMPDALPSLACWPAVYGLVFLLRSLGFAFNEVVVALAGELGAPVALRRFSLLLGTVVTATIAVVSLTPLGRLWFGEVTALDPGIADLAAAALPVAVLMPGYAVLQNRYQGLLVHARSTTGVTEAVGIYLVASCVCLGLSVLLWTGPGVHAALGSFTVAGVLQTLWLRRRARQARVLGRTLEKPRAQG